MIEQRHRHRMTAVPLKSQHGDKVNRKLSVLEKKKKKKSPAHLWHIHRMALMQ